MTIRLYTRAGCHLCEAVEEALAELAPRFPHQLERVDIDSAAALAARYGLAIPVVVIDRRYTLAAQITPEMLAETMARATRRRG